MLRNNNSILSWKDYRILVFDLNYVEGYIKVIKVNIL